MREELQDVTSDNFEDKASEAVQALIRDLDEASLKAGVGLSEYADILTGLVDELRERAEGVQEEAIRDED